MFYKMQQYSPIKLISRGMTGERLNNVVSLAHLINHEIWHQPGSFSDCESLIAHVYNKEEEKKLR